MLSICEKKKEYILKLWYTDPENGEMNKILSISYVSIAIVSDTRPQSWNIIFRGKSDEDDTGFVKTFDNIDNNILFYIFK